VDEIVDRANKAAYYAANDGKADVSMTMTDSQGRERVREFTILRLDIADGGEQKFYVYFKKPEDVRDMVYMVWKRIGSDDDRWLYLPALDLVRRIAASDKRSSFVGSDFVYEDVSGRNITEDTHELVDTADGLYKLKNIPKDLDSVEFAYYYIWIDKTTFLPAKAEYYDKRGKLYRVVEALETEEIGGYPTVIKSKVTDLGSGGNTVSEFKNIKYDLGLDENTFTERFLRRPPRQWID
jgi:outer membrane lipoprotein-sorting protein